MKELISVCLVLIVFSLWHIEHLLCKITDKENEK